MCTTSTIPNMEKMNKNSNNSRLEDSKKNCPMCGSELVGLKPADAKQFLMKDLKTKSSES